nr:protein MULTIPOLAR SPINDLE 1 isoform X3 [Ipomoea batatas]
MQQDVFPQGALCKCYFFDNLGQFCPISGDDCDQRFSDVLYRRFLRLVRINERKRRIPDASKGRECVSEDQSDTDVRFYIQHLMRKLGSNSYTGQRIILSVSQRISLVAEDYLLSWSISEEFDTRGFGRMGSVSCACTESIGSVGMQEWALCGVHGSCGGDCG